MREVQRSLLIGAVAGFAAAAAMDGFQNLWLKVAPSRNFTRPRTDVEVMAKIARRSGRKMGRPLRRHERQFAALLLHYGFGITTGALYSALASKSDMNSAGYGSMFGSLFFGIGDVLAPKELKPLVQNNQAISEVYEWLTHVIYGVTLEAGRRTGNSLLKSA